MRGRWRDWAARAVHDAGYGNAALLAERMDALVLSGGGDIHPLYYGKHLTGLDTSVDPHRDEREWELMRWFCAKKKPILGICRGMQVVDVFFGGTLFRHLGTAHVHDNTLHTIITAESGRLRRFWEKSSLSTAIIIRRFARWVQVCM